MFQPAMWSCNILTIDGSLFAHPGISRRMALRRGTLVKPRFMARHLEMLLTGSLLIPA